MTYFLKGSLPISLLLFLLSWFSSFHPLTKRSSKPFFTLGTIIQLILLTAILSNKELVNLIGTIDISLLILSLVFNILWLFLTNKDNFKLLLTTFVNFYLLKQGLSIGRGYDNYYNMYIGSDLFTLQAFFGAISFALILLTFYQLKLTKYINKFRLSLWATVFWLLKLTITIIWSFVLFGSYVITESSETFELIIMLLLILNLWTYKNRRTIRELVIKFTSITLIIFYYKTLFSSHYPFEHYLDLNPSMSTVLVILLGLLIGYIAYRKKNTNQ